MMEWKKRATAIGVTLAALAALVLLLAQPRETNRSAAAAPGVTPGPSAPAAETAYASPVPTGTPVPTATETTDATASPAPAPSPAEEAGGQPSAEEDSAGYTPWDMVSPELQASYKEIYTDEELDMLFKPRKWVTMPNVVGMAKDGAVAALKNLGIVPRVIYDDAGEQSLGEGICFAQDITPGMRWNTDASIFIWVQRAEATASPQPTPAPAETPEPQPTQAPTPTEPTSTPTEVPTEQPVASEPAASPGATPAETEPA